MGFYENLYLDEKLNDSCIQIHFFMFQLTATVCLQTRANDSSIAKISFERNDVAHVM